MQTITIKASLGWDHVDSLIRFLINKGFSVKAVKPEGKSWTISAFTPGAPLDVKSFDETEERP